MEHFNNKLDTTLTKLMKEKKKLYIMGDYNIDLLKSNHHKQTSDFLDILYSHGLFPLIAKPTRVTHECATLIDNIFTNDFDDEVKHHQGIFYNDISDHFPVFHINANLQLPTSSNQHSWKRTMNEVNMTKFINDCNITNWGDVLQSDDGQMAYTRFSKKISDLYNKHFPLKKIKRNVYNSRLPWLTPTLKSAIKNKNKLYI